MPPGWPPFQNNPDSSAGPRDGRAIASARVLATSIDGEIRSALSNPFGFYTFDGLAVGRTYIIDVRAKQYSFVPFAVAVDDQIIGLDLIALP